MSPRKPPKPSGKAGRKPSTPLRKGSDPSGRDRQAEQGKGRGRKPSTTLRKGSDPIGRVGQRAAEQFGGGGDLRRVATEAVSRGRADVIYGRNPVMEAVRAGRRRIKKVWATQAAAREPFLQALPVQIVGADELEERAGTDAHQGIVAAVGPYPYVDAADLLALENPLLVALDEVQDPQNLGAIARTAECAGANGLIIPERRTAEVTGAAAKASAGAVEHLPIAKVKNLADFLGEAKGAGLWCYGASEKAKTRYDQVDWNGGVVVVMGAEGKGIRPRVQASCDLLMCLPLHGQVGSLNVSAAAAVVLYEAARQRTT